MFLLLRIYFAFSPSYIHPDEQFQGPEVIAGNFTWRNSGLRVELILARKGLRFSIPTDLGMDIGDAHSKCVSVMALLWDTDDSPEVGDGRGRQWRGLSTSALLCAADSHGRFEPCPRRLGNLRTCSISKAKETSSSARSFVLRYVDFSNAYIFQFAGDLAGLMEFGLGRTNLNSSREHCRTIRSSFGSN